MDCARSYLLMRVDEDVIQHAVVLMTRHPLRTADAIQVSTAIRLSQVLHEAQLGQVIVGDPGSGKSTFLKYIALMLARSVLQANPGIALEALCLQEPLPIPLFVSCWDMSDFLRKRDKVHLPILMEFLVQRLAAYSFRIQASDLEKLLESGSCCLLFDGLDEVPTEHGWAVVSRLLEDCVRRFSQNRLVGPPASRPTLAIPSGCHQRGASDRSDRALSGPPGTPKRSFSQPSLTKLPLCALDLSGIPRRMALVEPGIGCCSATDSAAPTSAEMV